MLKLIIEDDERHVKVVKLLRDEITIGRQEGNTIRLTERNVSRKHARLYKKDGNVFVEDLGSYNGTKVNSKKITEPVQIKEDDKIIIGDYSLMLKMEAQEAKDPFEEMATIPVERMDMDDLNVPAGAQAAAPPPSAQAQPQQQTQPQTQPQATPTIPQKPVSEKPAAPAQASSSDEIPEFEQAKLAVESTSYAGSIFPLTKKTTYIGRTPDNDIIIDHKSISHKHARIEYDDGSYTIYDLQSSNGVRINGELYPKMLLRKDDTIDLGHVRIKFVAPGDVYSYSPLESSFEETNENSKNKLFMAIGMIVIAGIVFIFLGNKIFSSDSNNKEEVISEKAQAEPADISSQIELLKEYQKNAEWKKGIKLVENLVKNKNIKPEDKTNLKSFETGFKKELQNQKILEKVVTHMSKHAWNKAIDAALTIPQDSYYYKKSATQIINAKKYLLKAYYKASLKAFKKKNCSEINTMVTELEKYKYDSGDLKNIKKLQTKCSVPSVATNTNSASNPADNYTETTADTNTHKTTNTTHSHSVKANNSSSHSSSSSGKSGALLLTEAKIAWRKGNCRKAVSKAKAAYSSTHSSFAVKIVGICGCKNKKRSWAKWAVSRSGGSTKKSIQRLCQKNGLKIR